jgi:hypothetical protein
LGVFYFDDFVENTIAFSRPDQIIQPVAAFMPQRMVKARFPIMAWRVAATGRRLLLN